MPRPTRAATPWILLAGFVLVLLLVSWQRWGNPVSDPGLDLVVAAGWLHGVEPYSDVRYFYGPLGIGALAATFALLGTSLTAAFAWGIVQTAIIAELWRRLARRWLPGPAVAGGLAVVLAIGFSGSLFNFQLPHTESATTGLICLLGTLLAITAGRPGWAGVAIGAAALTRPEFLAFALVALAGAALGRLREGGLKPAVGLVLAAVPGGVIIPAVVLGWFAHQAGADRLFTENLFPVDFVRTVGGRFEHDWHPYDLPSAGTFVLRGVVIAGGAWAVLRLVEAWTTARGAGLAGGRLLRILAGPVAAYVAALVVAVLVATVLGGLGGAAGEPVKDTARDAGRLLLPMTALPAIALTFLVLVGVRWLRGEAPPLGGRWEGDLALVAVAGACTLRAYGSFSTDIYATYFAPPAVLLAAILLHRGAARLGSRQVRATGALLGAAAAALAFHAAIGRYADQSFTVHSPHGSYRADAGQGPAIQKIVDLLAPQVRAGEPMLVLPQEPGIQFLLGTRPAQYNDTFLPGTLAFESNDAGAANDLLARPPRFVVEAARDLSAWGFKESGVDVNTAPTAAVRSRYCVIARIGDASRPAASGLPATAFTVYRLRPPTEGRYVQAGYDRGRPVPAPPAQDC